MATKAEREALLKEKLVLMKKYENDLYAQGLKYVAGVDEVGRGPLAGPVVTACVVLPQDFDVLGIDDSKKLSEKKREQLFDIIKEKALACGIGMSDNTRIDEINILEATKEAMEKAVKAADEQLRASLGFSVSANENEKRENVIQHILIDALTLKNVDIPQTGIIKGDTQSVSIAAASIIAKVTRDRMMVEYAKEFPAYGFEKNKGYGTKAHYEGLDNVGICSIHRKSFLRKYAEERGKML
ncbi:MAG: ribonuclease HII [Anaerovoracaceae bacterium]